MFFLYSALTLLSLLQRHSALRQSQLALKCDFETACTDFVIDNNWGSTDGFHPHPLAYDHTYLNATGHYLFYEPTLQPGEFSRITTKSYVESPTDKLMCLSLWYYKVRIAMSVYLVLDRGDQNDIEQQVMVIQNTTRNWTQVTVPFTP
ncbi:unnamed protein product [Didymodactylos carnosus]|uniref:MAM domain-containing protein n=1 Tax=Didymodactylos carnosus TaxID=1234261 RepID=A0A8S2H0H5_9BILA|nr:unnamed protein product [Didymodactylos carnosus]CAF3583421.1 unnamed protein product [Didymodactylos carnosus]